MEFFCFDLFNMIVNQNSSGFASGGDGRVGLFDARSATLFHAKIFLQLFGGLP